jgi:hypothetical protein
MKQKVAQFSFQSGQIVAQNGIGKFVGLLDGEVAKRFEGLFFIPWTIFAQFVHDAKQSLKGCAIFRLVLRGSNRHSAKLSAKAWNFFKEIFAISATTCPHPIYI